MAVKNHFFAAHTCYRRGPRCAGTQCHGCGPFKVAGHEPTNWRGITRIDQPSCPAVLTFTFRIVVRAHMWTGGLLKEDTIRTFYAFVLAKNLLLSYCRVRWSVQSIDACTSCHLACHEGLQCRSSGSVQGAGQTPSSCRGIRAIDQSVVQSFERRRQMSDKAATRGL